MNTIARRVGPHRIFLFDGAGAVLTATAIGGVLIPFQQHVGMPLIVLKVLNAIACVFAICSFTAYFYAKSNWKGWLKLIVIANLLYSSITVGLVIIHFQLLTLLGISYFIIEVLVIWLLVYLELIVLKSLPDKTDQL